MTGEGVWERTKLGDLADWITKGATPTTYGYQWQEKGILFVRNECVRRGRFQEDGSLRISDAAHERLSRSAIRGGDVLVTITGDVGRACVFPDRYGEANINQHIARIRLHHQANALPDYVAHMINSPQVAEHFHKITRGVTHPHLSLGQIKETTIPLPPLDEQRRIVARIEALFERIEKARQLCLSTQEDSERLVIAALAESFESLRNNNHPAEQFGDLASEVRNGMSKRVWVEPPQGVASLNIGNVTQLDFSIGSCRRVRFDPERHFEYVVQPRDLLVCNVNGSPRLVGAVAVYPGASEPVVIDHNITRARMKGTAMPEFVAYHLREPATRVEIEARFATSSGQAYLPQRKLTTVPVIVPPLSEQRRIVEYLDGLQAQVDELRRLQAASAAELARLEGAVLARAFRGEL